MVKALTTAPDFTAKILDYFYMKTRELMTKESWTSVASNTRNVDVARDVLKYVPIYWACEMVCCMLCWRSTPDFIPCTLGWNSS